MHLAEGILSSHLLMEPAFSSVVLLKLNAQCLKVYEPPSILVRSRTGIQPFELKMV